MGTIISSWSTETISSRLSLNLPLPCSVYSLQYHQNDMANTASMQGHNVYSLATVVHKATFQRGPRTAWVEIQPVLYPPSICPYAIFLFAQILPQMFQWFFSCSPYHSAQVPRWSGPVCQSDILFKCPFLSPLQAHWTPGHSTDKKSTPWSQCRQGSCNPPLQEAIPSSKPLLQCKPFPENYLERHPGPHRPHRSCPFFWLSYCAFSPN